MDNPKDNASLHLWQKRNFLFQKDSKTNEKAKHLVNMAQIMSAFTADNLQKPFVNMMLENELNCCLQLNSIKENEKDESLLNKTINSQRLKAKLCKELASTVQNASSCLQEVQRNPSLRLIQTKTCNETSIGDGSNSFNTYSMKKSSPNIFKDLTSTKSHNLCQQPSLSNNKTTIKSKDTKRKYEDIHNVDEEIPQTTNCFKSAREQLVINQKKKFQKTSPQGSSNKKSLGSRPRNQCFSKFIPPSHKDNKEDAGNTMLSSCNKQSSNKNNEEIDPKLKGIEPQLIELVMSEIMDHGPPIAWDDIAGLEFAKATIKEIVIWPMLRPDIFTGLRGPPKGILLFGPPGTGKTLIGKCIANQSGATFFSISASSLTSKWIGQAEKMVRALFTVASLHQPAVIFIDEIDSLLSQRSDTEHESSRRIKTEFFVQLDGATTSSEDRILVVGATNRPQEIDEAARRRLVKRLYIPLPDDCAREQIITKLLKQQPYTLSQEEVLSIVAQTDGYSGADVTNLCKDAALGPIRSLQGLDISKIRKDDVRPINIEDFYKSLQRVRASVSQKDLVQYEEWNQIYGCGTL